MLSFQIQLGLCKSAGCPSSIVIKNPPANAGDVRDVDLISGSARSPGGGNGNSLQYSCLENPMDRGAWWATVLGVTESQTWLSDWAHTYIQTLCKSSTLHSPGGSLVNKLTKRKRSKRWQREGGDIIWALGISYSWICNNLNHTKGFQLRESIKYPIPAPPPIFGSFVYSVSFCPLPPNHLMSSLSKDFVPNRICGTSVFMCGHGPPPSLNARLERGWWCLCSQIAETHD